MQKCDTQNIHGVEQEIDKYPKEDSQIDTVNIDFIDCNAKRPGIIAKLKTSSYQHSADNIK